MSDCTSEEHQKGRRTTQDNTVLASAINPNTLDLESAKFESVEGNKTYVANFCDAGSDEPDRRYCSGNLLSVPSHKPRIVQDSSEEQAEPINNDSNEGGLDHFSPGITLQNWQSQAQFRPKEHLREASRDIITDFIANDFVSQTDRSELLVSLRQLEPASQQMYLKPEKRQMQFHQKAQKYDKPQEGLQKEDRMLKSEAKKDS